ncbi:MAG: substrate-binding domain-containing protein, partial [Lachnospiraceae bacterium]|nr:substrate-binding domain-containing protein [Lachnospiraceae bacterium]
FESARAAGEESGVYVEFMGRGLPSSYTGAELVKIAMDAAVDGIIVEADESEEMTERINAAVDAGIPVVTLGSDCTGSSRQSYVGVSFYTLGQIYGEEILRHTETGGGRILVLASPGESDTYQNIIYSGLQDTINRSGRGEEFSMEMLAVNDDVPFGAEESISDLIRREEKLPEDIVCLNELNTTCAFQALIDYNRVGESRVFGYYENSSILSAIRRGIVTATAVIDTDEMGRSGVEALNEYLSDGYVNEYIPADIRMIDAEALKESEEEDGDAELL